MKTLFLCRLYWPHIGGVEKHVSELSKLLIERGQDITVITESHDPKLADTETHNGVKIVRIPLSEGVEERNKKWIIWKWFFARRDLFRNADIIHIHDVFFWFLPFRLPYWNKKVFMTFHGYEGTNPSIRQKMWHKLAAILTRGNICIGNFHKKWYGVNADYISYGAV